MGVVMLGQSCCVWLVALSLAGPTAPERHIAVDGLVRLIEYVDVPARRDGRLEKFVVKEGAYVQHDAILGRIDAAEARLTLERTQLEHQLAVERANSVIALKSARLIQEVSNGEFQRAILAKQAAPASISITEFERLRLEAEKSTNELTRLTEEQRFAALTAQSKSVEMQLARLAVEERQVLSPIDGIIVQIHRREGEWVHQGEKVIRIVRIDRLRVEAYVNLHSALSSLDNARAVFDVDFPDLPSQQFEGEVVFLNPEADPVNGQIRIWAEIENRGRLLRPGQRGRLKVYPQEKPFDALQLLVAPTNDNKPR